MERIETAHGRTGDTRGAVDMSSTAITARLRTASNLRRLCLSLAAAGRKARKLAGGGAPVLVLALALGLLPSQFAGCAGTSQQKGDAETAGAKDSAWAAEALADVPAGRTALPSPEIERRAETAAKEECSAAEEGCTLLTG